jgi:hypothetical protein
MLDGRLWLQLEAHGLSEEHMRALLRFLECRKAGAFAWHCRHGQLDHCELRLSFPAKSYDIHHVSECLFGGGEAC